MSLDISLVKVMPTEVYSTNITHNLVEMATAACLYEPLWYPKDLGITKASELIIFLKYVYHYY